MLGHEQQSTSGCLQRTQAYMINIMSKILHGFIALLLIENIQSLFDFNLHANVLLQLES